jgi:hypothetical protein
MDEKHYARSVACAINVITVLNGKESSTTAVSGVPRGCFPNSLPVLGHQANFLCLKSQMTFATGANQNQRVLTCMESVQDSIGREALLTNKIGYNRSNNNWHIREQRINREVNGGQEKE